MSKQWTDADVARMLGWEVIYGSPGTNPAFEKNGKLIWWKDSCFGLSTPPSPEANANAARYVLPWLRAHAPYFKVDFIHGNYRCLVSLEYQADEVFSGNGEFSTALCTAALEAYHAKGNDDAK
jgi:hypothetical protein